MLQLLVAKDPNLDGLLELGTAEAPNSLETDLLQIACDHAQK